jgi:hypothetical protein
MYACTGANIYWCPDSELQCHLTKSIFAEIRQQKMLRKIYRLSSKVNLLKKRLDRLTNKTL